MESAARPWFRLCLALLGIVLLAAAFWRPIWPRILRGDIDFQAFYISGQLVFHHQLYDAQAFETAQTAIIGHPNKSLLATRPPFFAVAFWPLAQLPYRTAWLLWLALLHAAAISFIYLWPDRRAAAQACCWSAALSVCLLNGQDLPFIILWLALVLRIRESRPGLAGLLLSLCAAKFHLFVLLPVLLLRWRLLRGFAAGAAALLAVSFAAAGWDWPRQYAATLAGQSVHPRVEIMPNLHGIFDQWPHHSAWEVSAALLVAAAVIAIVKRANFARGLAAVLTGGLLIGHHAYLQDCVLLLPALLIELPAARGWGRALVYWLLIPASAIALIWGNPVGDLMRLPLVAFLGWILWDTVRGYRTVSRFEEASSMPATSSASTMMRLHGSAFHRDTSGAS